VQEVGGRRAPPAALDGPLQQLSLCQIGP